MPSKSRPTEEIKSAKAPSRKAGRDGAVITLTTDFGLSDGFAGVMRGVILTIAPGTAVVDLSHDIPPFDLRAAQWIVRNSWSFFPAGTTHVVVVDPGVGSPRKALLLESRGHRFVGPDNGLFSWIYADDGNCRALELTKKEFWLRPVFRTFHGRDIYAAVAAHTVSGVPFASFGEEVAVESLVQIPEPRLVSLKGWIDGEVVYEDRFGNLVTNIPATSTRRDGACILDGRAVGHLTRTYSSAADGEIAVVVGSHGCVEIGIYQGRASNLLGAGVGSSVRVESRQ